MQIIVHKLLCLEISVRLTHKQKIVEDITKGYYSELTKIFIHKA